MALLPVILSSAAALLPVLLPPALPPPMTVQVADSPIAQQLSDYVAFCESAAKPAYRTDCLAERLDVAADHLGRYGDTAELYKAMKQASAELEALSRRYGTPDASAVALSTQDFTTTRPIRPVAASNLATANQAATEVLDRATRILLRSAGRRPDVLAFQEVAAVLGTAKVLLRAG